MRVRPLNTRVGEEVDREGVPPTAAAMAYLALSMIRVYDSKEAPVEPTR